MDPVLQRLQKLQAELAAIDPSRELDAADKVAAIAAALRDTLKVVNSDEEVRLVQMDRRRAG